MAWQMFSHLKFRAKPSIPRGQRVYAIGDVHGRSDLLQEMLTRIEQDSAGRSEAHVTVVLLGDLIDRGPDSRGVVALAKQGFPWGRIVSIMGNHEASMLDALDGQYEQLRAWLRFGGRQTMESWGLSEELLDTATLDEIQIAFRRAITPDEHFWIAHMLQFFKVGDYFFTHAGVKPGIHLRRQSSYDCMWIRDQFLSSKRYHGAIVVHGHSISKAADIRSNRIGIDTGAYASGVLTAIGLEGYNQWIIECRGKGST